MANSSISNISSGTIVSSDSRLSAFTRSLEGFRRRLSAEEQENFELTTYDSLVLAIKEIQRDQAQRRTLRNLNKIKPFLRFLQDYARVIEQFVTVKPDFLAFIWIASRLHEAFDALLDTYARIGEALPLFSAIDVLHASHCHGHVQQILADVYEDILTFHKRAVVFFKQPAWKIAFDTTINSFGDKFGDVAKNLERSKELLVQSASVSHFQEAQDARLLITREFKAQREYERREQTMTTVTWLSSVSWKDQHEEIQEKRRDFSSTARWIFNTAPFCGWLRNDDTCSPVFWLYGIPGAGKTFLFNSVIDEVNVRLPCVQSVYFYCRYNDPAKRTLNGIARSLVAQILALNPACLQYLYDKATCCGEPTLGSTRLSTQILTKLAEYHDQLLIGIDGLDECEEPEKRSILAMIHSILEATKATRNVRLFLTSRKELTIEKSLRSATAFEIKPHHLEKDINCYVRVRTLKLSEMYSMDAERQQWIITEISQRSQGMFLLARLVMDNLMDQDCEEALEEELNNRILPRGIDQAYGRILVRMQKKDAASKSWERAKLALDLIVMATRLVRTHDIQGALSISTQDGSIKFEQRRSLKPLEELLGPMVEVHPDDMVTLVHPTAKDFLLQHHSNYFINPSAADFRLATLCTSYLTFKCFGPFLDGPSIKRCLERADYAFQEYATFNWIHHVQSCETNARNLDRDQISSLELSVAQLCQQYLVEDEPGHSENVSSSGEEENEPRIESGNEGLRAWRSAYARVESLRSEENLQKPMPSLLRRALEVRMTLEELPSQVIQNSSVLTDAYGKYIYKCPITQCTRFFRGFRTRIQREEHLKSHERKYKCTAELCDYSELGFATSGQLTRHIQLCHCAFSEDFTFPSVQPASTSKALKDAIDRDDELAVRDICDAQTVHTIGETGFLLRAIRKKSLNAAMAVMELLGTTSEVNHKDISGTTALHEVVVDVKFEILLKEMLKTGVDCQISDRFSQTPLSKALGSENLHAVSILLSIGSIGELNLKSCRPEDLRTGVHLAAAEGEDDVLKTIFPVAVQRTDVDSLSKWISTALNNAAFHNHRSTVFLILTLGRSTGIEEHYKGMVKDELAKGLEATVKLLMKCAVDPEVDRKGRTQLRRAVEKGDSATVTRLLEKGTDVNYGRANFLTPLEAALRKRQVPMMKLLLDKGAKVDARHGDRLTPLGEAARDGYIPEIQLLLENGADPKDGIYPASQRGKTAAIKFLLEHGANVNALGPNGLSNALTVACSEGHVATVKLLLELGADVNLTALTGAAMHGSKSIVKMLLKQGADVNAQLDSSYAGTALIAACSFSQVSMVKLLLENGADVNQLGLGGESSALSAASRSEESLDVVRMLLEHGADVNAGSGQALKNASVYKNEAIVQLLREYGAE